MKPALLFSLLIGFSAFSQSDSLLNACLQRDSIRFSENLAPFFKQLKNGNNAKILQIGDSHVQMGHFPGGIEEELNKAGVHVTNTAFWFPYELTGGYNASGIKVETDGDWIGEKMVGSQMGACFGLTGHALVLKSAGVRVPSLKIQTDRSFETFELLIETNKDWQFAGDSTRRKVKRIGHHLSLVTFRFDKPVKRITLHLYSDKKDPQPMRILGFRDVQSDKGLQFESYGSSGGKYSDYANKCAYFSENLAFADPDLVIVSLGTNDAFGTYTLDEYYELVSGVIEKIRHEKKHVSILLTSQPDTFFKGQRPASDTLVNDILKCAAFDYNCGFWDFEAVMGGQGSIHAWAAEELVSDDLLHFNRKGYLFQAKLLAEALRKEMTNK